MNIRDAEKCMHLKEKRDLYKHTLKRLTEERQLFIRGKNTNVIVYADFEILRKIAIGHLNTAITQLEYEIDRL